MKNENFNIHLKTLDDQALYREICKKIHEIEAISFRLFLTVPLISWIVILVLWLEFLPVPSVITLASGVFGALVTYFIYCWERQNMTTCQIFRKQAALLESRKNRQEKQAFPGNGEGPYTLINKVFGNYRFYETDTPSGREKKYSGPAGGGKRMWSGWGKPEAETAVYLVTILLWILTVILGLIRIYMPSWLGYNYHLQSFIS